MVKNKEFQLPELFLKNSPIILLDEATSALDSESENMVQEAIKKLTKNKTTLVIAHRLSTILNADKIFIMKNGKVIDNGSHEELMKKSQEYKSLYNKQLN